MTSFYFPQKKQLGFTLVELIVVILLVGILSVSVAPRFFGIASYEDRRAADELRTAIRHTQQMAMNRGENIQIIITSNNFRVERTLAPVELRSPDGITHSSCDTPFCYVKDFPQNVTPSITPTIIFDRMGRPDAGHNITLGSQAVTIEEETGYAR
ncbi:MAG: type II secretion system GspH family protein [Gammaproteobacteria bacterium]|nr:type II secretion system GspH family protein [Gammaproteobacteria bacterium]